MMPYNDEAERAVLYCMLGDEAQCSRGIVELSEADFYNPMNRTIFNAIFRVAEAGKQPNLVTVVPIVEEQKYLYGLVGDFAPPSGFDSYVRELKETRGRRDFCIGVNTALLAARGNEPGYIQQAQAAIDAAIGAGGSTIRPVGESAFDAISSIGKAEHCIQSGFRAFDNLIKGMRNGELIVIGARPSTGKTSFAMNIAVNVAERGQPVLVFSLETFKRELLKRAVFSLSSVSEDALLYELNRLGENGSTARSQIAAAKIAEMPLYIDDHRRISVDQIAAQCYGVKRQAKGLSLVVIDYLGLIKPFQRKDGTREREIAEITRSLKILAGELDCPIILLSQLNREVDKRTAAEPKLSDLRESGAIEQDADIVAFICRDKEKVPNEADIDVAKNRNGNTGRIKVGWRGEYFRFESIEQPKWCA